MTQGPRLSTGALGVAAGLAPATVLAQSGAEPTPVVVDFEASAGLGFQPSGGWTFGPVRNEPAPQGAVFARLSNTDPAATPAQASRAVPAAPYTGQPVRLRASLRTSGAPVPLAGLWLRVDGSAPGAPLFFDNMADRPVAPGDWVQREIIAYVPANAERVVFGLVKTGAGTLDADQITLAVLPPAGDDAMSAEARAYLDDALNALQTRHINRASADWPHLRDIAARMAGTARAPAEVHPAIRTVIGLLGERHTLFIGAARREVTGDQTASRSAAAPQDLPTGEMTAPGIARLTLPALMTEGADDPAGPAYRDALAHTINALQQQGACRWIVDLRGNGGGNMWPMLNGLEPLLGEGPFGAFGDADRVQSRWVRREGLIVAETVETPQPAPASGRLAAAPVAVLFGPGTASSGEMTAIAFRGRTNSRSFGQASAGNTTANAPHRLPDGARILITTMGVHDGDGVFISGPLLPDEPTSDEQTLTRAVEWLQTEACPAPAAPPPAA